MNELLRRIANFKPYMNEDTPPKSLFILVHLLILSIFCAVLFFCN